MREGVGELAKREFVKDLIAENLIEAIKAPFPVLVFLAPQFAIEKVAQEMAARGESKRELLRPANAFRRGREEASQQVRDRLDAILARPFRLAFEIVPKATISRPLTLPSLFQMNSK